VCKVVSLPEKRKRGDTKEVVGRINIEQRELRRLGNCSEFFGREEITRFCVSSRVRRESY
jgi:hypothetical protein